MRHCELRPSVYIFPGPIVLFSKRIGSSLKSWRVKPLMLRDLSTIMVAYWSPQRHSPGSRAEPSSISPQVFWSTINLPVEGGRRLNWPHHANVEAVSPRRPYRLLIGQTFWIYSEVGKLELQNLTCTPIPHPQR